MAKASVASLLPEKAAFTSVNGDEFVRVREAAKLAGLHPVVLEMGRHLLDKVGTTTGGVFKLETPDLQRRAADIEAVFKTGLRKVAKAFKPNVKLKVKSHKDGSRLVFWYSG